MVDSPLLQVAIPCDASTNAIRRFGNEQIPSGKIVCDLRPCIVPIPRRGKKAVTTQLPHAGRSFPKR